LEKIDTVHPRVWKYTSPDLKERPGKVLRNDSGLFHFVPEPFVRWKPLLEDRSTTPECPSLLPFTFHLRTDLVLHASGPIQAEALDMTPLAVSNILGQFTASVELPDPTTLVFHYDLSFYNDVIDRSLDPMVEQLQSAVLQRLRTPVVFGL